MHLWKHKRQYMKPLDDELWNYRENMPAGCTAGHTYLSKQHIFNLSLSQVQILYWVFFHTCAFLHLSKVYAWLIGTSRPVAMLAIHLMTLAKTTERK